LVFFFLLYQEVDKPTFRCIRNKGEGRHVQTSKWPVNVFIPSPEVQITSILLVYEMKMRAE
jgi:hypothetical protein